MSPPALPTRRSTRSFSDYDRLRPDGRWSRLLAALGAGPADIAALLEATDQRRYPLWRERRKIRTALFDMADLGWVQATHWGWVRTVAGSAALAEATPATSPETCTEPATVTDTDTDLRTPFASPTDKRSAP